MNENQLANFFGCTVQDVRALHTKNAQSLRVMLEKAERTGKKVNGYSVEQLRVRIADAEILSQGGQP